MKAQKKTKYFLLTESSVHELLWFCNTKRKKVALATSKISIPKKYRQIDL